MNIALLTPPDRAVRADVIHIPVLKLNKTFKCWHEALVARSPKSSVRSGQYS